MFLYCIYSVTCIFANYFQEACQCYKLAVPYFRTYYNMVKKLLNRANLIKEHNGGIISTTKDRGIEINVKNEGTEVSTITSSASFYL